MNNIKSKKRIWGSSQRNDKLTLIYMGGGGGLGSFFATVQKRFALECWNFVTFTVKQSLEFYYTPSPEIIKV